MKQVWKCGHCTYTNPDGGKVKRHELDCWYNPNNKTCLNCHYYYEIDTYSSYDGCGTETICELELKVYTQNCKSYIHDFHKAKRNRKEDY